MTAVQRSRLINGIKEARKPGPCVYWMSRDQRVEDNWALIRAAELAREQGAPLAVVFALTRCFPGATLRTYDFLVRGLQEVASELASRKIAFQLLKVDGPSVGAAVGRHFEHMRASAVVTDFSPLTHRSQWNTEAAKLLKCPLIEVDAHNVVPTWIASPQQETAARTFRPKIHKLLPQFLTAFPQRWSEGLVELTAAEASALATANTVSPRTAAEWREVMDWIAVDDKVPPVVGVEPGYRAAMEAAEKFVSERLKKYDKLRNDPGEDATSRLSPYLHYGHISAQRLALLVRDESKAPSEANQSFLEELIVRRELADNFCYYNPLYTKIKGCAKWAQETLEVHVKDKRDYIYTLEQFEQGKTHDSLWNAAQRQMVARGHMHGYMRMYWCKKILEWTRTPQEAMDIAIYLNDTYSLDGRDPNGYVGIAWSIGGIHDMGWTERKIFGKIRFMNRDGCKRKFSIEKYEQLVARQASGSKSKRAEGPTALEELLMKKKKRE